MNRIFGVKAARPVFEHRKPMVLALLITTDLVFISPLTRLFLLAILHLMLTEAFGVADLGVNLCCLRGTKMHLCEWKGSAS